MRANYKNHPQNSGRPIHEICGKPMLCEDEPTWLNGASAEWILKTFCQCPSNEEIQKRIDKAISEANELSHLRLK